MTETTAPTAPIYIGWQNRGKLHTNARCGMTSRNLTYNSPVIVTAAEVEFIGACGRCGHQAFEAASPEAIRKAADTYVRLNRNISKDDGPRYIERTVALLTKAHVGRIFLAASEPQGPETAEDAFRLALTGSI